jgi:hypothetical protein
MKKWVIFGGVVLFVGGITYYLLEQYRLIRNFTYDILSFNITQFDTNIISGDISILFKNYSNIEITINEFYLDFYFNGYKVGFLQDVTPFIIPPSTPNGAGQATIPFEFTLDPSLIITDVSDILAYTIKQKDAAIAVNGYASIQSGFIKGTVPVAYSSTVQQILHG